MTTILKVEGMSCEHCVRAVNNAVSAIAGVVSAQTDLKKKQVTIEHNDTLSLALVMDAIREEGYEVEA